MKLKWLILGFIVCFSILGMWAFWLEPAHFIITEANIKLARWHKSCDGLKVVLLSDLHVGSPHNDLENLSRVIDAANQLNPDLILLAGDYVIHEVIGGHFVKPEPIAEQLEKLTAPLGVYAVLGNHDWWYSEAKIKAAFNKYHIPLIDNQSKYIKQGECKFWLAGIGDYWMGQHGIEKALADIPKQDTVLAFTHNPDVFYELPERISMTFAGHTHGGQVNLPVLGRLIVPSHYGEELAIGHIKQGGNNMFVTTGIGTSILPVRFRVPPEIALIRLYSKSSI